MANPYAPPVANVADPAMPAVDVRYAGFWRRFWALFIDDILLLAIIIPVLMWMYGDEFMAAAMGQGAAFAPGPAYYAITNLFPIIATILFWKYRQATPGKMLLGLKIVDASTLGPLGTGQMFGRYFAYIVSGLPLC